MPHIVVAGLLMSVAACLSQTASAQSAPDNGDANKRTCRDVGTTGSILSKRVCHTRKEWATIKAASERAMDDRHANNTVDRSQGKGNLLE